MKHSIYNTQHVFTFTALAKNGSNTSIIKVYICITKERSVEYGNKQTGVMFKPALNSFVILYAKVYIMFNACGNSRAYKKPDHRLNHDY